MANTCISATAETALTGVAKADAVKADAVKADAATMTEIAAIITGTMEDAATETATNAERMNKGA